MASAPSGFPPEGYNLGITWTPTPTLAGEYLNALRIAVNAPDAMQCITTKKNPMMKTKNFSSDELSCYDPPIKFFFDYDNDEDFQSERDSGQFRNNCRESKYTRRVPYDYYNSNFWS